MWARLVVMPDELGHHVSEVATTKDQEVIERFSTYGSHPSFGEGVRPRSAERSLDNLDALSPQDLVEARRELGVAVTEQEPGSEFAILDVPGQMPRLLHHPVAGGMCRAAGEMHTATANLDEEQDVQRLEPNGLDGEEVGSQDLLSVLPQELAPGASTTLGRWWKVVAPEHGTDRFVRAAQAELEQLTLDAAIAPAWVFASQT